MAQGTGDVQSLLELLRGGQQGPIDPRAQFLAQLVQGRTQAGFEGDQTSDINTILDLLSPGQTASLREAQGGPQALQQATGLGTEDVEQVIRQQFGLDLAPLEQAKIDFNKLKVFAEQQPKFIEAKAKQKEAGVKEGQLKINRDELELEKEKIIFEKKQYDDALNARSPEEQAIMIDSNFKVMATTGKDLMGNKVSQQEQRNAFRVINGESAQPGLQALIGAIAKKGDKKSIAKLANALGIETSFVSRWWSFGIPVQLEITGAAPTGGVEPVPGAQGQVPLDPDSQAVLDELNEQFGGLLQQLNQ